MRDLASHIKLVPAIPAASYNATVAALAVDGQGFETAVLEISIGAGGITFDATNKIEFPLTHSSDGVTYTPVVAADVVLPAGVSLGTGGIVKAVISAHAAADVTKIGYIGAKRYRKVPPVFSGTHGTATPISANWIMGTPSVAPAA